MSKKTSIDNAFYEGNALRTLTRSLSINHNDQLRLSESELEIFAWGLFSKLYTSCQIKNKGLVSNDFKKLNLSTYFKDLMATGFFEVVDEKLFLKFRDTMPKVTDDNVADVIKHYRMLFKQKYSTSPTILKSHIRTISDNLLKNILISEMKSYLNIFFTNPKYCSKYYTERMHNLSDFFSNINAIKRIKEMGK